MNSKPWLKSIIMDDRLEQVDMNVNVTVVLKNEYK